jgi:hypothetical protein
MRTSHFDRSSLPPARSFYLREFGTALSRERRGWAQTKCCFHDGESKTSLALNLTDGHFCCFSCGVKGGDVLAFARLRYRWDFETAAKELGAWRGDLSAAELTRISKERAIRERKQLEAQAQSETDRQQRVRARDDLHRLEQDYLQANARLTKLRRGATQRYRGEESLAWWFLSDLLPRIREAEATYYHLAGLEVSWPS